MSSMDERLDSEVEQRRQEFLWRWTGIGDAIASLAGTACRTTP
jgi:hypothetical protein